MSVAAIAALVLLVQPSSPQEKSQEPPTLDELGKNPELFLRLMVEMLGWEAATPPARIAGPLYFVGTKGLGAFLLETTEGLILINSGMQSSGPMIEASIRALGFRPEDIKIILAGHGHVDHVGGHAYLKGLSGAEVVMMEPDVSLLESGGKTDFFYRGQPSFEFEPVVVDRVLRDGEHVRLGEMDIEAILTPGHTRGAMTLVFNVTDAGRNLRVVIPDGSGVNPGYRLATCPTYPGILSDYMATLALLGGLEPDIWLPLHNEAGMLREKIEKSKSMGAAAFVDPDGYASFVQKQRATFEERAEAEEGSEMNCQKGSP